jgi:hypothetical protein
MLPVYDILALMALWPFSLAFVIWAALIGGACAGAACRKQ